MGKDNFDILIIGDAEYKTLLTDKYKNRPPFSRHKVGEITAFIPGTIEDIFVKEGDTVEVGQVLLILQAMKMKNRLESPINGVVKQVMVKSGEVVPKNHLLVIVK